MEDQVLIDQPAAVEAEPETLGEDEILNTLTTYFRRTSRGGVVDLPRWAQ